jgi:hypothetical protein
MCDVSQTVRMLQRQLVLPPLPLLSASAGGVVKLLALFTKAGFT